MVIHYVIYKDMYNMCILNILNIYINIHITKTMFYKTVFTLTMCNTLYSLLFIYSIFYI